MLSARTLRDVNLGIQSLLLHKMRSVLTMLGVVFGVGSVIAMLSIGEGAEAAALAQLRQLGSTNIMVWSVKPAADQQGGQQRSYVSSYGLLYEDVDRIVETIPTLARAVPVRHALKDARLDETTMQLRVVGTTEGWFALVPRDVIAGRLISAEDVRRGSPVAVLTESGARKLLAGKHIVNQPVKFGGDYFTVVGVVRPASSGSTAIANPDQSIDAYVPITAHRQRFGETITSRGSGSFSRERVELHGLIVEVDDEKHVEATAESIGAALRRFHPKPDYRIDVPLTLLRQTEETKRRWTWTLAAIAAISLLVGGIGIMNIMLATVTERTREIGVRRAIGARRNQIISQFLIEAVVLTTLGGLIGITVGPLFAIGLSTLADMPIVIPLKSVFLSLGISVGVGIAFGIYPAYRAAMLDPIVALRHE